MKRTIVKAPEGYAPPRGHYSHGVIVDTPRTLYVAGQVPVDKDGNTVSPGDAGAQTRQVMENLKTEGQLGKVEVNQDLAPDLPNSLLDSELMQQVFINLASNAKHAMDDCGTLTISTKFLAKENKANSSVPTVSPIPNDGGLLRVKFSDTGKGIQKESMEKIFDPFFSTDPDMTGLGLSVSYSVVEKHGGTITADSNGEKGATFIIDLPLVDRDSGT